MMGLARLALRDLGHDRRFLATGAAIIASMLIPVLVLVGAEDGFYNDLVGELMQDPHVLKIETTGNGEIATDTLETLRALPGVAFVIGNPRAFFNTVRTRVEGRDAILTAVILPTAAGDPLLPEDLRTAGPGSGDVVISESLARRSGGRVGDKITVVTQSESRETQLRATLHIAGILDTESFTGLTLLADADLIDAVEAFYEGYALPVRGIRQGRALAERRAAFEAVRLHVTRIENVEQVQDAVEDVLGMTTFAETDRINRTLDLGRNLTRAASLMAAITGLGLSIALATIFFASVERKVTTLAVLSSLGAKPASLAAFPLCQALAIALIGTAAGCLGYWLLAVLADAALPDMAGPDGDVLDISRSSLTVIVTATLALSSGAALLAARRAGRIPPAIVIRGDR